MTPALPPPRRRPILTALAAALLLSACAQKPAPDANTNADRPPVEAHAGVDKAVATTGDLITYKVTVDYYPAYQVEIPEPGADIAGFRIVEIGSDPTVDKDGRRIETRWYQLRADLVGSYVLPPITVEYHRADEEPPAAAPEPAGEPQSGAAPASPPTTVESVQTSAIFVEVASVLPAEGGADDIHDIKPLQPPEPVFPWRWIALAGAVLLGGLAGWWWWRRRSRKPAPPPAPAHEIAFAALDRLRGTDFSDPEAVRRFHFEVSEVIRSYIEGRWGLNATDLTSEEIIGLLSSLRGLDAAQASSLRRFLLDTDRVKFAHHQPATPEIEQTYERALSFVEATRPAPEPVGEAAAPTAEERAA
ncbi:MAG: hypothetical protein KDD11_18610 [Acidobacteria bacterium]|nr:hypothetical protein [Acidobacteriota bacterium]